MGAVVARGNVMTKLHNRGISRPESEESSVGRAVERAWATACFAGSVAIHMPGYYLTAGRLWWTVNSLKKELRGSMPEVIERIESGETDYCSVAAELAGIETEADIEESLAATRISDEE
jgi:hypothetical protein